MLWCLIAQIVTVILDVLRLRSVTDLDKDLELLVLRQQIRILERRVGKPVCPSRVEKLLLALTAMQIKDRARTGRQGFKNSLLLFKPATILKWHRELVTRKWAFQRHSKVGRPRLNAELAALIVRLAKENPGLGYEKLQGELEKLGVDVGISTVRDVCKRHHILPAPERGRIGSSWRTFLNHYRTQILACDFFTRRNCLLADSICPVLYRAKYAARVLGWLHRATQLSVGHSTSSADALAASGQGACPTVSHP